MMSLLKNTADNLFFIVGCGRSGTTLLKTMLNCHPDISIPHETFFFTSITKDLDGFDSSTQSKINVLKSKWWIQDMEPDFEEIQSRLSSDKAPWSEVFLSFLTEVTSQEASVFGEKTPSHVLKSKDLLERYPAARVIQIVRDPRAVCSSFKTSKVGPIHLHPCVKEWKNSAQISKALQSNQRYKQIKFESLIQSTEQVLAELCHFLNLEYCDQMLDFDKREKSGFSKEQSHHKNTLLPIFSENINQWKHKLTGNQISLIEHTLKNEMATLGYGCVKNKVLLPKTQLACSFVLDKFHKTFVRKPRQIKKQKNAIRRLSRDKKQE